MKLEVYSEGKGLHQVEAAEITFITEKGRFLITDFPDGSFMISKYGSSLKEADITIEPKSNIEILIR